MECSSEGRLGPTVLQAPALVAFAPGGIGRRSALASQIWPRSSSASVYQASLIW